ncbi:MAG: AAA-like domain-containing protein [Pseudanabaena sp. M158S2SP1A06QC]|nr:AAA-like domain-containing protein [Pseudanabaena sp. M158S2SP1A06QC]
MLSEAEFARSLTEVGLFGKHLTTRLAKVERDAHPTEVLQSLVNSPQPIRFDLATTAKLDGMGLALCAQNQTKIFPERFAKQTFIEVVIPQALTYMMANPYSDRPMFGLVTNGSEFIFLKLQHQDSLKYAESDLFSIKRSNDL